MASGGPDKSGCRRTPSSLILKEGFLYKKGGIIKIWSRKYFVLTRESLCYFKRESETSEPIGRVFLSDVVNIATEGLETKRAFVFALLTKRRGTLLQCSNNEDREGWIHAIKKALETDKEAERKDPFRKTLRRLEPGVKRVTLVKDPQKGIGCTIKNAAGHILVNRIIEDGPIAITGVLRPGDEILDIQGTTVTGLQIHEIGVIIKNAPEEFLATVRPLTVLKRNRRPPDNTKIIYSAIVPMPTAPLVPMPTAIPSGGEVTSSATHVQAKEQHGAKEQHEAKDQHRFQLYDSMDDVGTYDDEDGEEEEEEEEEECMPPPVPRRTDDALVLLSPSPSSRARNLKASSEGNLISLANEVMTGVSCGTPPESSPPPPVPLRTDEAMMTSDEDTCPLPHKWSPLQPQATSVLAVNIPAHDVAGKGMQRCLSEDNALCEPSGGAANVARDSRSLQRRRQHDYDEITMYAELAPLKSASKR